MSKIIETLNTIFDERFIEASHDSISEPKENMKRDILKGNISDEDILICRLDQDDNLKIGDLFPYLRGDGKEHGLKGMKRISDYAIFIDKGTELFVLLFELKKGKESPRKQLEVTEPWIDFIFRRAKKLGYIDNITYIVRKIGITDIVDKRKTNDHLNVVYNEGYVKLYGNRHIYLQHLLH